MPSSSCIASYEQDGGCTVSQIMKPRGWQIILFQKLTKEDEPLPWKHYIKQAPMSQEKRVL